MCGSRVVTGLRNESCHSGYSGSRLHIQAIDAYAWVSLASLRALANPPMLPHETECRGDRECEDGLRIAGASDAACWK